MPNDSSPLHHALSGLLAGATSTTLLHPLDLLKTRLQVDPTTKPNHLGTSINLLRRIWREEGGVRGVYRGWTPNLVGSMSAWGIYFWVYTGLKVEVEKWRGEGGLGSVEYLLAAAGAGAFTTLLTNPIWVIKTRMIVHALPPSASSAPPGSTAVVGYRSLPDALRRIWREEGIRGYYRGLVPALFGVSHGAVQFAAYEKLKNWENVRNSDGAGKGNGKGGKGSTWSYLWMSATSKIVASVVTYPYQVVKSRIQSQPYQPQPQPPPGATPSSVSVSAAATVAGVKKEEAYKGILDVIRRTWRAEGIAGFYKGLAPNVVRVTPATCVTFVVYETCVEFLRGGGD
ncbi:mitochondrial carrier [Saitoella complicata NRRL Y-17804]|uniref:mitochondrial carrier n=1 Tax=Saitoella complicata (strain BCRC 22490 / CBS 7301 / JCM 7358 / NBRC 10748 / NRRL Y-17804) TaxID=698492 RepID=UPI0008669CF2|nr:mitochondrial carrier [Saitoella complicata NRRL Y-17804]ODQ51479.1 mitochondrial carrier [Saitoella complicata NRRL Y-17804]